MAPARYGAVGSDIQPPPESRLRAWCLLSIYVERYDRMLDFWFTLEGRETPLIMYNTYMSSLRSQVVSESPRRWHEVYSNIYNAYLYWLLWLEREGNSTHLSCEQTGQADISILDGRSSNVDLARLANPPVKTLGTIPKKKCREKSGSTSTPPLGLVIPHQSKFSNQEKK